MPKEKTIWVTGASGGLGIPVSSRLLEEGWRVFALVHHRKGAATLKRHFPYAYGKQLSCVMADLTDPALIEKIGTKAPFPDAVVHLAGGFQGAATLAEHTPEVFDQMFHLNVRSAFLLLRTLLPGMKEKKRGAIVTIGARPAVHPGEGNAAYAASKAALINLTLSIAEEGRAFGVRANVVVPAVIRTPANAQWASSEKETEKWTPPEDIARVVAWLVSEAGASVTGTVIPMYHGLKP
jgi:NAD(P)-dependent dehydrogenase (short-subunit alcohol dehydrogenase family)